MNKYKKGQAVRFNLTNQWHYGTIKSTGWKWYTVNYKKAGKLRTAMILKQNSNTDLAEI